MKHVKFVVGGAALVSILGIFLKWVHVEGSLPKLLASLPMTGMDNGGPVFLFLLAMPLLAAGLGARKRFGRGLAVLALLGALGAAFMGLVKYDDIESASRQLAKFGGGAQISVAAGYWVFFGAATVALLASLIALIKPEPQPAR